MHDEDDVVGLGHAPARQGLMGSENALAWVTLRLAMSR